VQRRSFSKSRAKGAPGSPTSPVEKGDKGFLRRFSKGSNADGGVGKEIRDEIRKEKKRREEQNTSPASPTSPMKPPSTFLSEGDEARTPPVLPMSPRVDEETGAVDVTPEDRHYINRALTKCVYIFRSRSLCVPDRALLPLTFFSFPLSPSAALPAHFPASNSSTSSPFSPKSVLSRNTAHRTSLTPMDPTRALLLPAVRREAVSSVSEEGKRRRIRSSLDTSGTRTRWMNRRSIRTCFRGALTLFPFPPSHRSLPSSRY
jgi:hypothetical protein